ncbi:CapA family protein [Myroides odoratimimus]|uniref:CapA family protein n=1 Tax=Myroides odoratimimus TaxID=76832 RepID=UPI00091E9C02|nr:CapA family protein [Myroides odoratimimus]SHM66960.1 poly-gamma-glutamate synthesis protein (capsule biosynthesis protein) [Myroides odoratimimus subsp. xuanwuensis]
MKKVLISADFCPNGRVVDLVDKLDCESIFNDVKGIVDNVDFSIVNLECPIRDKSNTEINDKIGPVLYTNENAVKILKNVGFDCATLANNHIKDLGGKGVLDTIEVLERNGIEYVGAGKDREDAQRVLYVELEDLHLGIINVTENEFSCATIDSPGANGHNLVKEYSIIIEARQKVDFLLLIYHGGHEGYNLPSPRIKDLFRMYVELGVDSVICHHSHVCSGYETYKGKPIFYGLGNFSFDWPNLYSFDWIHGCFVELFLIKNKCIDFRIVYYKQGSKENSGIVLLNQDEEISIKEYISKLNSIILNDDELGAEFFKFCSNRKQNYLMVFEPYTNRILKGLFRRGVIPSFFNKNRKRVTNIIRCESHRDVVLEILEKIR